LDNIEWVDDALISGVVALLVLLTGIPAEAAINANEDFFTSTFLSGLQQEKEYVIVTVKPITRKVKATTGNILFSFTIDQRCFNFEKYKINNTNSCKMDGLRELIDDLITF
jgi:hypothetical protein